MRDYLIFNLIFEPIDWVTLALRGRLRPPAMALELNCPQIKGLFRQTMKTLSLDVA
jgi:hypothetical protein